MVVPSASIFAQQPLLATIRPVLIRLIRNHQQSLVVESLENVDDVYKEQVLRLLVSSADQYHIEIESDIWEAYYPLKTPSSIAKLKARSTEPSTIRFDLIDDKSVKTQEDRNILVQSGQTGHRTWESSMALVEYICKHPNEFAHLDSVIESGAGTGLVSLTLAALFGINSVYATDGSEIIIDKLQQTAADNDLDQFIKAQVLDWENPGGLDMSPQRSIVFAGDILYGMTSTYAPILNVLKKLNPSRTFFCNPVRNPESYKTFKMLCTEQGYKVNVLQTFSARDDVDTEHMFIVSVPPIPSESIELTLL